jgi:hypothetical protein
VVSQSHSQIEGENANDVTRLNRALGEFVIEGEDANLYASDNGSGL